MQKTIIFCGFAAMLCLAVAARAEDGSPSDMRDGAGVTGQTVSVAESGRRDGNHEREARPDRSREHTTDVRQREARDDHDAHEASEHRRRR